MEEGKVRRERKSKRRIEESRARKYRGTCNNYTYMYGLNNIILTIIIPHTNMPYIPHHQQEERKKTIVDEIGSPICGLGWMLSTTCFPLLGVAGVNFKWESEGVPPVCLLASTRAFASAIEPHGRLGSVPAYQSTPHPEANLALISVRSIKYYASPHALLPLSPFPPSLFVLLPCSRFTSHRPHLV